MAADSNDSKLGKSKIADFPSEHVLAHEGSEWQKSARSTLAAVHLAVTAETGEVPMLEEIIDIHLTICVDHDLPHDHGVWYDRREPPHGPNNPTYEPTTTTTTSRPVSSPP